MGIKRVLSVAVAWATVTASVVAFAPGVASAAGGRLAYLCRTPLDICTVDGDGSGAVRLLNDAATDNYPAWSPDGSTIAFQRGPTLSVMRADGTGLRTVTAVDEWRSGRISWSPDGTRLAFANTNDVYVVRLDGTGLVKLTNGLAHVVDADPAWSPDGTRIAYRSDRDGWGCWTGDATTSTYVSHSALYVMNADGTGSARVTPAQNPAGGRVDSYAWPEWSPGSSSTGGLAYNRSEQDTVYYADGNHVACSGAQRKEMVVDGKPYANAGYPSLSPDGTKIAYALGSEVYVVPRSGGTAVRVGSGTFPDWRPASAPPPAAACADGRDNDADGKIDYPADPGCASATDSNEQGVNLLKNPGFELDANADGRPDAYTSTPAFTRSATAKRTGTYSGRHAAADNSSHTVSQVVPSLVAGRTYLAAASVAIPATSDAFTYRVQVRWRSATGATISTHVVRSFTASTSGAWVQSAVSLTAPAGTTNAQVLLVATSLNGTVHVDDVSLKLA